MPPHAPLDHLSDPDLLAEVTRLARCESQATAALVASLAELDTRRLYLGEGCSSLFTYCTQVLHLSEHAAYRRIEAARTARRCPLVLERLAAGEVTLTAIGLLAPHLTPANGRALLDEARHQSKRVVEEIVARLAPRPDVPASVRKLPERRPAPGANADGPPAEAADASRDLLASPAEGSWVDANRAEGLAPSAPPAVRPPAVPGRSCPAVAAKPALVRPLAPARYQLQVTLSAEGHARLRRAQDLLRHAVPDGDPAQVVERALALLVDHLERTRLRQTTRKRATTVGARTRHAGGQPGVSSPDRDAPGARPGPVSAPDAPGVPAAANAGPRTSSRSRYIPAAVARAVWTRDRAQCAFVGPEGRCRERGLLELHHRVPFAAGGTSTIDNLQLRCRAHNGFEAERDVGAAVARQHAEGGSRRGAAATGSGTS